MKKNYKCTGRFYDFYFPEEITAYLAELDTFINEVIKPRENRGDTIRLFDRRSKDARTDWERDGLPQDEWEALLDKSRRRSFLHQPAH